MTRDKTDGIIPLTLGQLLTSEVRSMTSNSHVVFVYNYWPKKVNPRPEMWPTFEIRHVSKHDFYFLSDFQRTKASQDIPPFV